MNSPAAGRTNRNSPPLRPQKPLPTTPTTQEQRPRNITAPPSVHRPNLHHRSKSEGDLRALANTQQYGPTEMFRGRQCIRIQSPPSPTIRSAKQEVDAHCTALNALKSVQDTYNAVGGSGSRIRAHSSPTSPTSSGNDKVKKPFSSIPRHQGRGETPKARRKAEPPSPKPLQNNETHKITDKLKKFFSVGRGEKRPNNDNFSSLPSEGNRSPQLELQYSELNRSRDKIERGEKEIPQSPEEKLAAISEASVAIQEYAALALERLRQNYTSSRQVAQTAQPKKLYRGEVTLTVQPSSIDRTSPKSSRIDLERQELEKQIQGALDQLDSLNPNSKEYASATDTLRRLLLTPGDHLPYKIRQELSQQTKSTTQTTTSSNKSPISARKPLPPLPITTKKGVRMSRTISAGRIPKADIIQAAPSYVQQRRAIFEPTSKAKSPPTSDGRLI